LIDQQEGLLPMWEGLASSLFRQRGPGLPEEGDQGRDPQDQGEAPEPPVAPALPLLLFWSRDRQRIGGGEEAVEPLGFAVPPKELESMFRD
jgi:hypothetical protein